LKTEALAFAGVFILGIATGIFLTGMVIDYYFADIDWQFVRNVSS
jgi:hypothetical protein